MTALKNKIKGNIKLIFQPAEEGPPPGERGGAQLMIEEGVLDEPPIAAILGLHVWPGNVGEVYFSKGAIMASSDWFEIIIKYLTKTKKKKKTSIVVLDSIDAALSFTDDDSPRDAISGFFHSLRDVGFTTLIVSEAEGPAKFLHHEDRLADGVITLGYDMSYKKGTKMTIHCTKMRHTKHSMDYYHLNFDKGEFFISRIKV